MDGHTRVVHILITSSVCMTRYCNKGARTGGRAFKFYYRLMLMMENWLNEEANERKKEQGARKLNGFFTEQYGKSTCDKFVTFSCDPTTGTLPCNCNYSFFFSFCNIYALKKRRVIKATSRYDEPLGVLCTNCFPSQNGYSSPAAMDEWFWWGFMVMDR